MLKKNIHSIKIWHPTLLWCCCIAWNAAGIAQQADTLPTTLQSATVTGRTKINTFKQAIPAQQLDRKALQAIGYNSMADAAKYFAGVLVKDYGGVGGLKTVSVRSLGAGHTAVLYDGIPLSDIQNGQIDLGKFTNTLMQGITLSLAEPSEWPSSARAHASAAVISMQSKSATQWRPAQWQYMGRIRTGSFGLWQPAVALAIPIFKRGTLTASVEHTQSEGNYPIEIKNGSFTETRRRTNADVRMTQAELNFTQTGRDSSRWQTKIWAAQSDRGLPGAIVFFNTDARQRLFQQEGFAQTSFKKKWKSHWQWMAHGKYNYAYTRFTDPDFLNNQGFLQNWYRQQELFGGMALSGLLLSKLQVSLASDGAITQLASNLSGFAQPTRTHLFNNLSVRYTYKGWQWYGGLLHQYVSDRTKYPSRLASTKSEITPTISAAWQPQGKTTPWLFRAFYKRIFRMPTFNDLYYTQFGNNNLKPEYAHQINTGVSYSLIRARKRLTQISGSADVYYNQITDRIVAVPGRNLFFWSMINVGRVQILGADLNIELKGGMGAQWQWYTKLAYTWQQALDVTDKQSAKYRDFIPYTPQHSGAALLQASHGAWSFGSNLLFSGKRFTLGENSPATKVNGFWAQDVFAAWQQAFAPFHLQTKLECNNVWNTSYDIIRYFPMPGIHFNLNITISNFKM